VTREFERVTQHKVAVSPTLVASMLACELYNSGEQLQIFIVGPMLLGGKGSTAPVTGCRGSRKRSPKSIRKDFPAQYSHNTGQPYHARKSSRQSDKPVEELNMVFSIDTSR